MKKIIALALALVMSLSLTAVFVSAENTFVPEKVGIATATYGYDSSVKTVKNVATLYDGVTGDNKTSACDDKYGVSTDLFTKYASGDVIYGETLTGKTYSDPTSSAIVLSKAILDDQTELTYVYNMTVTLSSATNVGSVKFYMHGYKPGVLDRSFSVLVSADGQTWKKVFTAGAENSLVGADGLLTTEGQTVYAGAVNVPGAAASSANAAACVTVEFETVENVKYVMWACHTPRFNNSHYTARFTEVEVYTGEVKTNPSTGDTTVLYVAAIVAVATCAVAIVRKKEN